MKKQIATPASVTPAASATVSTETLPTTLTVTVVDTKGQPSPNASVSITPSNASGMTNSSGQIMFKLGTATKYDITATYGSHKVTVPYYVVPGGASQMLINPTYVASVEKSQHSLSWSRGDILIGCAITLGVVLAMFLVWRFLLRAPRRKR